MDINKKPVMDILGVPVTPFSMDEATAWLMERVAQHVTTQVVTANAEIIMMAQEMPAYRALLEHTDLILADGAGTVWAGRKLGYQVPERVAGFDLFLRLLACGAGRGTRFFLFGAAPGVAEAAKEKAEALYPGVKIVGTRNGYFEQKDEPEIIRQINESGADVLFAALGAPKQEFWLQEHRDQLKPALRMGLGGSFDVLAGKMERAPKWMQEASLEWLFRLYKQPSRLGRMMALPRFVVKVLEYKNRK
ncbi:WecB/TagA/CpsF family glycosyltransferase [Acidaminococcus timonensis]|jgi:N-acetylglucosaminyldiphosphoundecaprenol N-acetyl-beta-D-mannosaminyltransferase|uniref:WecB/TagA/CpsF family glycosyltransferase n=1 Tax=Acidaminococcus timonensis TaxID=1871002 RepID=UPI0009F66B28|nr:WecB/TagA/CpsF family glycosyltransferase [Acidaminococcus timonensis]